MTLKEANFKLELIEIDLRRMLDEKEEIENELLPESVSYDLVKTNGGKRVDKYALHMEKITDKKYLDLIDKINKKEREKRRLIKYVDETLKALNKYGKLEQEIVYYKETYSKTDKNGKIIVLTWREIANLVHCSPDHARKIYRRYIKRRDVDIISKV